MAKCFASNLKNEVEEETNIINKAKHWLQISFSTQKLGVYWYYNKV